MVSTRRTMLAALLGMGAAGGLVGAVAPLRAAPLTPLRLPDAPLRLERRLERGLGDGVTLIVERSWEVQFTRQGRGIVLSGAQIAAAVNAPPNLADLAQIEQRRDTSAMFPLMLSETGLILSPVGAPSADDALAAALRTAEAMIDRQSLPVDMRERSRTYLGVIHKAGSGRFENLPGDLFFPVGKPVERSEAVALPDGLTGSFTLIYKAQAQADVPWLDQAERQVVTRIGALERTSTERWSLGPI